MVKHLREKLKTQKESQKGTRADAIIQMHHPPTTPQLFNINIKVKRQEKGPEVMLCNLQTSNQPPSVDCQNDYESNFQNDFQNDS